MTSKEFQILIERCVEEISLGSNVSTGYYKKLKPFLEKELGISMPPENLHNQTYIDLWRYVNGKLGEGTSTSVKSRPNKATTDGIVMIPKGEGKSVIPVSLKVAKKLKEISKKIKSDNEELDDCLDEIQSAEPTIDIGSYLGVIVKPNDVETSIYEVYSSLCGYIVKCGDAIRASNGNISNILELIQLLTAAEVDLYHLMDNQAIQSNELRVLIKEWCQKHGIHDEEVDKLLESSFQRAYTLRDRINDLRNDFYDKIEKNNEQTKELLSKFADYQAKIEEATDSAILDIKASTEERKHDIENISVEKQKEFEVLFAQLLSNANKEIKRIEAINSLLDERDAQLEKKIGSYFETLAEKERTLNQHSEDVKEHFSSVAKDLSDKGIALEEMSKKAFAEVEHSHQVALGELQKRSQAFQSDIENLLCKKDEATDKKLKQMKENQDRFKNDISKTLNEKLQGLANMHKQFIIDQTSIIDKLEGKVKKLKIVAIIAGAISIASVVLAFL